VNPITGTRFNNAESTKMVHISEFTADLIKHDKLKLDPSRNDHYQAHLPRLLQPRPRHGACWKSRATVINNVLQGQLLRDAPANHPRADLLLRRRCGPERRRGHGNALPGRLPRRQRGPATSGNRHGVNMLACVCAIDRAALPRPHWITGYLRRGTAASPNWWPMRWSWTASTRPIQPRGEEVNDLREEVGPHSLARGAAEEGEDARRAMSNV
jgi:hypothetical protein